MGDVRNGAGALSRTVWLLATERGIGARPVAEKPAQSRSVEAGRLAGLRHGRGAGARRRPVL